MGFTRWVRSTSEHYLMIDAQDKVARRLGTTRPAPPRGVEIFWRRIYVPLFYLLPAGLRNAIIAKMPGSHQKRWVKQAPLRGPAVTGFGELTSKPPRDRAS
ncbi:hypothetical protein [Nocardioides daejeonensis]|uniref:hypothetical protein n=1 Tax=Nocardioides daejeonensis TaxID=1046556 RepID=UPI000D740E72|nr:hypothetical protein [Nocardioides daejeonensis]